MYQTTKKIPEAKTGKTEKRKLTIIVVEFNISPSNQQKSRQNINKDIEYLKNTSN